MLNEIIFEREQLTALLEADEVFNYINTEEVHGTPSYLIEIDRETWDECLTEGRKRAEWHKDHYGDYIIHEGSETFDDIVHSYNIVCKLLDRGADEVQGNTLETLNAGLQTQVIFSDIEEDDNSSRDYILRKKLAEGRWTVYDFELLDD